MSSIDHHLVLLSTSNIKTSIVKEVFSRDFELHFVKVPDNPGRPTQPLYISGTKEACATRFEEYFKEYMIRDLPDDTVVISIENGILALDSETGQAKKELMWADFCMIGMTRYDSRDKQRFFVSPEVIAIDQRFTREYFAGGDIHPDYETLGKLIVAHEKEISGRDIPDNNWMKDVAGIDRHDQIRKGLLEIRMSLDIVIGA
jgi:hypothetical protein